MHSANALRRFSGCLVLTTLALVACDDSGGSTGFDTEAVADRARGNAPLRVGFRARTSGPLDAAYTYAWDFADGTRSEEAEPSHLFANPGAYTVSLDVTATPGGRGHGTVAVEVLPPADLEIGDVQVVPQRARAGEDITLTFGVRNAGAPAVGSWDLVLFVAPSPAYDERAVVLEVVPRADDATSMGFEGDERIVTLPADLGSGEWFVGVIADPSENIGDSNRVNNLAFTPFPLEVRNPSQNGPDLTVCGLAVPGFEDVPAGRQPEVEQGSQLPLTTCLGNVGDAPVGLASYAITLSRDEVADAGDRVVGLRAELPLGTGDREEFEDILDIPADLETGTWYIIGEADPDDAVAERDESNNLRVLSGGFKVVEPGQVEGVDLALVTLSIDQARAFWGQRITGQLEVRNRGSLSVERAFVVRLLALPVDGGAEVQLPSINVPRLAAGTSQVFAIDVTLTRLVPMGRYRLAAEVDPTNASGDVNRTNNRRTLQDIVDLGGQPDFDPAIAGVTVSANRVQAGDMLTIAGQVENRGGDETGPFEVAIFFSQDGTFEPTDPIIQRIMIPNLAGGDAQAIEQAFVVPMALDQQVGSWRVGLMADPDNQLVGEASEANNFAIARDPVQVDGATGGCNEDEENEDNDIPQGARRLGGQLYEGLGMCDGADWFSVRVPAGRLFEVALRWNPQDGSLTLRQADQAGAPIRSGEGLDGELRFFEPSGPDDVTYYFEVAGNGARLQYDLEIGVVDPGAGPNLRVRGVTPVPAIAQAGATVDVAFQVVNVGGSAAAATRARVDLRAAGAPVQLGMADVPALDAGTFAEVRARVTLADNLADGRYSIEITADSAGTLAEGNEDDNTASALLRVDADQACRADPLEPNGSVFEVGGAAGVAVIQAGQYNDLVVCDGDDDWYAVDLQAGQRLAVEAAFRTLDGDLEMTLYGPDGQTVVDRSASLQNVERVELLRAPQAGRYFVRVFLNPGDEVNVTNQYALAVSVGNADDCVDDPYQPNGAQDQAALLPDGRHDLVLCPGDEDWFRFPIPAGNTVSFQLAAGDAGARLTLFDPEGMQLADDARRIVQDAPVNGIYTLRIAAPGDQRAAYVLTVTGVSGVDLAIDSIRLSSVRAAPGEDVRVDLGVSNRRGDAVEDVLTRYYFSLDANLSPNDRVLGERSIARIEGAAVLEVRQRLRLPADLRPDDGYIITVLDPDREVADLRPANNVLSTPLAVVAACIDDDQRENEGPATASPLEGVPSPLAGGVICAFTEDWYALPVAAAGDVNVDLRFQHARGDLDLEIYAEDGMLLGESRGEGDLEHIALRVAAPGTLLIRVDGFLDARNDYTLSWTTP